MIDETKVSKWLVPAITKPRGNDFCMLIQCRHYNKDSGTSQLVEEFQIREPGNNKVLKTVEEFKQEIIDRIQLDSSQIEGHQEYQLIPFYGEGKTKPAGRLIIKVYGVNEDEDTDASMYPVKTEGTSDKGREAMRMRHEETMFQVTIRDIRSSHDRLERENQRLMNLLERSEAKNDILQAKIYSNMEVVEKLTSQAAKRQIMEEESKMRMVLFNKFIEKGISIGSALVNQMMGYSALEAENPVLTQLESLICSFEPEEWQMVEGALYAKMDPVQRQSFQKYVESVIEKKKLEQAKIKGNMLTSAAPSKLLPNGVDAEKQSSSS